jgi:hypothetical protein
MRVIYITVSYRRKNFSIEIDKIKMGELKQEDWERREGTQWAFLKPQAEAKLQTIYP